MYIHFYLFMSIGEQKATNALKEAANVLADSPSALQLRYLQVIKKFAFLHHFKH